MTALLEDVAGTRSAEISDDLLDRYRTPGELFRTFANAGHKDDRLPVAVDRTLRQAAKAFLAAVSIDAFEGPRIRSTMALMTYLRYDMAPLSREHFRVLYLDNLNRMLADRVHWVGTVDAVQSHPREIVRNAIELSATALILVHNHPNGSALPSNDDLLATRLIARACAGVGIVVQDHIIVGSGPPYSMRRAERPHLDPSHAAGSWTAQPAPKFSALSRLQSWMLAKRGPVSATAD